MTLTSRDKRTIVIGGAVILLVVLYQFALVPWSTAWAGARERIDQAASAQAALASDEARLRSLERQLSPHYGAGLDEPLPRVEEARVAFVKTVEDLLKSNGLESRDVRSQPLRPLREVPGVALVGLQVECQGQATQLMQMLSKLPEAKRPILVQRLHASPDAKQADKLAISLTLGTFAEMEDSP